MVAADEKDKDYIKIYLYMTTTIRAMYVCPRIIWQFQFHLRKNKTYKS